MKLYQRFLFVETLKISFILFVAIFIFFSVIDFFERFADFFYYKKPVWLFFEYLFWKGLLNIYQVFPYLLSFASLLTLFYLSRTRELLALLSLGYSLKEIIRTFFATLIVINFFFGLILTLISPRAYLNAVDVWERKISDKKKEFVIFREKIFFEGDRFFLVAKPLEPNAEYLGEVVYVRFGDRMEVEEVLWAKSMIFSDGRWRIEDAIVQEKAKAFFPQFVSALERDLGFSPSTLLVVEKTVKFLTFYELYQRWQFLNKIGKKASEIYYEVCFRLYYLFYGALIGLWTSFFYLKGYSPHTFGQRLALSLLIALFLSFYHLVGLNFMERFPFLSIFALLIFLFSSFLLLSLGARSRRC